MQPKVSPSTEVLESEPDSYLVLNKDTGHPYEFGPGELYLLQLMDGGRSPEEIRSEYQREFGRDLRRQHLLEFVNQLRQLGLIEGSRETPVRAAEAGPAEIPSSNAALNRRFDLLTDLVGWVFHPIVILPASLLAMIAVVGLAHNSERWLDQIESFSAVYPALLVVIATVVNVFFLSLPRELLVGAACRQLNGWVRGFGFHFIRRTIPWILCDIGDSLVFMNERGRWTMLTLRLWVHLVIASLAAIGWMMAPPDSALSMFLLVLLLTAGAGFLLRLSIFARTDGYVILSYLLDRNDLQEWAVAEVRAWLTLSVSPQPCTDRERFWLRAYGLGILALRRIVVPLFLGFAGWLLIARLDGTGALIGIVMILWWFQDSIRRFFMDQNWFRRLIAACSRWWMRWTIRLLLLAGIVAAGFIPYNYEIGGDCRLVPMSQYGVRAQISDEIVEVHVAEGDLVNPGDPLVTLAVREERAAVATTRADLQRAIAQLELLEAGPLEEEVRMAEESVERWRAQDAYWAAELKRVEELQGTVASPQMLDRTRTSKEETARSLQASIEYLTRIKRGARDEEIRAAQAEVQRLTALLAHHEEMLALGTITAPVAGRVITSNVQERVGQTVQPGDLIAVLHDTSSLLGEVAASESAALQIKEGMPVKARLRGIDGRLLMGTVHHLSGNAVEDTQFDVEPIRSDREAQFQQVRGHEHDRRVRVYVALDHYDEDLVAGMTGYARIVVSRDVLWRALMRPVLRFFRVEVWSWFP